MKTLLLTIFFCICAAQHLANGQALPGGSTSPSWTVYHKNMVISKCLACKASKWNQTYFPSDTTFTIDGKEYYKIISKINCGTNTPYNKNIVTTGYYRTDSNQVFYHPLNKSKDEYMIYDFSLSEGDTFRLKERDLILNVVKTDSVTINGKKTKRLQLTGNINVIRDTLTWYKGIGSDRGPFYNTFRFQIVFSNMRCYLENDKKVFIPGVIQNCNSCLASGKYFGPNNEGMQSISLGYQIGGGKIYFAKDIFESEKNQFKVLFFNMDGSLAGEAKKDGSNKAIVPKNVKNGTYMMVVISSERRFVSRIKL